MGRGKAQVSTAALWPMWAGGGCAKQLAGGDPEGSGEGKVRSSTFNYIPDTDGKAKSQLLQLSSRQMAGILLEFPAKWACRPSETHRCAGGSAHIQAGWLECGVLKPTGRAGGQSGPLQRGERPAANLMLLSTVGYHLCSPPT